jgi:hypothetical protein
MLRNCEYCSHVDECEKDHTKFNDYACGIPCDKWYPNNKYKVEEFDNLHEQSWRYSCNTVDAIHFIWYNLDIKDPLIRELLTILNGRKPTDDCYKRIGGY